MAKKATKKDLKSAKLYVNTFTKEIRSGSDAKTASKKADREMWRPENWSNFKSTVTDVYRKKKR